MNTSLRLLLILTCAMTLLNCGGNGQDPDPQTPAPEQAPGIEPEVPGQGQDQNNGIVIPSNDPNSLSVLVLGSGGPVAAGNSRASAGYVIFAGRTPVALMDAGGGTFQRLAASGVNLKDLELILLSHLHIDHAADLPAFIKNIYFQNQQSDAFRITPLRIFGPGENAAVFPNTDVRQYPATSTFLRGLFDLPDGVYRYLNIFSIAINGGEFAYSATDVSADLAGEIETLVDENGLVVKSMAVHHGPVPAVAFRIDFSNKSIVYSGDTSSRTNNLIHLAENADLLIYDAAVLKNAPEGPDEEIFFQLHATPARIGEVATAANVATLVLSHIGPANAEQLETAQELIRQQGFGGEIIVADDLDLFTID